MPCIVFIVISIEHMFVTHDLNSFYKIIQLFMHITENNWTFLHSCVDIHVFNLQKLHTLHAVHQSQISLLKLKVRRKNTTGSMN